MAHTPLKMSIDEAHNEVRIGWANSYSPEAIEKAVDSLNHKPLGYRINILIARLCFRGIYFPQMGRFAWVKTILENRRTNTQTDKARVRTRAGQRAVCRDRASHKADALKPSLQPGPVACPHHSRLSSVLKILNWAIMASRLVGRFLLHSC